MAPWLLCRTATVDSNSKELLRVSSTGFRALVSWHPLYPDKCIFMKSIHISLLRGGARNFPMGGLTLPTRGLKYGFQSTIHRGDC